MTHRTVVSIHKGYPTSDGAGVKLTRVFDARQARAFDPFLMLDEFRSEEASDYVAGFPPHPHRGFETVTYMHKLLPDTAPLPITPYDKKHAHQVIAAAMQDYQEVYGGPLGS